MVIIHSFDDILNWLKDYLKEDNYAAFKMLCAVNGYKSENAGLLHIFKRKDITPNKEKQFTFFVKLSYDVEAGAV